MSGFREGDLACVAEDVCVRAYDGGYMYHVFLKASERVLVGPASIRVDSLRVTLIERRGQLAYMLASQLKPFDGSHFVFGGLGDMKEPPVAYVGEWHDDAPAKPRPLPFPDPEPMQYRPKAW